MNLVEVSPEEAGEIEWDEPNEKNLVEVSPEEASQIEWDEPIETAPTVQPDEPIVSSDTVDENGIITDPFETNVQPVEPTVEETPITVDEPIGSDEYIKSEESTGTLTTEEIAIQEAEKRYNDVNQLEADMQQVYTTTLDTFNLSDDAKAHKEKAQTQFNNVLENKFGLRKFTDPKGKTYLEDIRSGKIYPYTIEMLDSIEEGFKAALPEMTSAGVAGLTAARAASSLPILHPLAKVIVVGAAGLAGSAVGAAAGDAAHSFYNTIKYDIEITQQEYLDKMVGVAASEIAMAPVHNIVGRTFEKLLMPIAKKGFKTIAEMPATYQSVMRNLQKKTGLSDKKMENYIRLYGEGKNGEVTVGRALEAAARASHRDQLQFVTAALKENPEAYKRFIQETTNRSLEVEKAIGNNPALLKIYNKSGITSVDKDRRATDWVTLYREFTEAGVDANSPLMKQIELNSKSLNNYELKVFNNVINGIPLEEGVVRSEKGSLQGAAIGKILTSVENFVHWLVPYDTDIRTKRKLMAVLAKSDPSVKEIEEALVSAGVNQAEGKAKILAKRKAGFGNQPAPKGDTTRTPREMSKGPEGYPSTTPKHELPDATKLQLEQRKRDYRLRQKELKAQDDLKYKQLKDRNAEAKMASAEEARVAKEAKMSKAQLDAEVDEAFPDLPEPKKPITPKEQALINGDTPVKGRVKGRQQNTKGGWGRNADGTQDHNNYIRGSSVDIDNIDTHLSSAAVKRIKAGKATKKDMEAWKQDTDDLIEMDRPDKPFPDKPIVEKSGDKGIDSEFMSRSATGKMSYWKDDPVKGFRGKLTYGEVYDRIKSMYGATKHISKPPITGKDATGKSVSLPKERFKEADKVTYDDDGFTDDEVKNIISHLYEAKTKKAFDSILHDMQIEDILE